MIRIAQASSSEYGTATGTPPNQLRTKGNLDGELNVIPFYSSNWQAVFRAKDSKIADKIADLAFRIVSCGNLYGYGQQTEGKYARTGLFDTLFQMPYPEPEDGKTPVNCDCTSFAGACVYFAGVYSTALRTMNSTREYGVLMDTGAFVVLKDKDLLLSASGVKRGDIFWRQGHTMIALDSDKYQETYPAKIWNCKACNVRTGASTDYGIIRVLHAGDIVKILSSASNGWKQIWFEDTVGFVSGKFIVDLPTATATGNVWMRDGIGTSSNKILVVPNTATVYLTGKTGRVGSTIWYEIIYTGKQGWASGKYIKPN